MHGPTNILDMETVVYHNFGKFDHKNGIPVDPTIWWSFISFLMINKLFKELGRFGLNLYLFKKKNNTSKLNLIDESNQDVYKIKNPEDVGYFIIINNEKFKGDRRRGSEVDVKNLKACLSARGFEVKIFNNVTDKALLGIIHKFSKKISNTHAVFGVCILSHGDKGVIYGINKKSVQVEDIKNAMFYSENAKPRSLLRLLILQACRGQKAMEYINVPKDVETDNLNINETICEPVQKCLVPKKRDLLVLYPNAYGYNALRHKTLGTPLITSLCNNIRNFGNDMHLGKIIRQVMEEVGKSTMIQAPEILSSCRKEFFFPKTSKEVSVAGKLLTAIVDSKKMDNALAIIHNNNSILPEEMLPIYSELCTNLRKFLTKGGKPQHVKLLLDYLSPKS
ncbi:caspase-3-like [Arctopsyche grandis]|uniref:caspase-3-like n=1 Tax=Arctopsyche grandis TaxID=121162 RepID=UPI00406D9736